MGDEAEISLEHKELAAREEEQEEQDYDENGEGGMEDEEFEDGQFEDSGGEEYFAPQASDDGAADEVASATKAVCCKMWKCSVQWSDSILLLNRWILSEMQKIWRSE